MRHRYVLVLLVLASATVITLDYRGGSGALIGGAKGVARDLLAPAESALRAVLRPVGSFVEGAARYHSVAAENSRLRQEITRLQAQARSGAADRSELKALSALDHLPYAPSMPKVVAEVVSQAASNFQATVDIDKGTSSGIRVGMPVVSGSGLVGRVVAAASQGSTVLLAEDPSSAVGVRFGASGTVALATGNGLGSNLTVDYVDPGTKLFRGELMVTSGDKGELYPPGIPVGTVASAVLHKGALQQTVGLAPLAPPGSLQFVSVLLWLPSTAGPQ